MTAWRQRPAEALEPLDFNLDGATYSATSSIGRRWEITKVPTGWRLAFIDPGDRSATFAGTFSTLETAQTEAER